jgi:hypothetical protein
MARSIQQRVDNSFDNEDRENVAQYLDWLRNSMSECASSLRRTVLIALLLIAAFELIVESPNARIAIGDFEIYKGSIILLFLPLAVACLYIQMTSDSNRLSAMGKAFGYAFEKWSRNGSDNDLQFFIRPAMPIYWAIGEGSERADNRRPGYRIASVASLSLITFITLGAIAFEVQAYILLYQQQHNSHWPLWVLSCAASSFLGAAGFAISEAEGVEGIRAMRLARAGSMFSAAEPGSQSTGQPGGAQPDAGND